MIRHRWKAVVAPALAAGAILEPAFALDAGCAMSLSPEEARMARQLESEGVYVPIEGEDETVYVIPLALHVVRESDGSGGLSDEDLQQSVADLTEAFAQTGLEFCQFGLVDYIDSDFFYFQIDSLADINLLRQTNVVPDAINIYFTETLPGLCGISSFTFSDVQGIVMNNFCTAEGDNPSTVAHEVGHYLNLYHTHETSLGAECVDGSNCDDAGDLLCDTTADPELGEFNVDDACTYVGDEVAPCPFGKALALYDPDPSNYMSYSLKHCRDFFSPMQIERMRTTLVRLRPEIALTSCPGQFVPHPNLEHVSEADGGGYPNFLCTSPDVASDGREVVFSSRSDNLVPDDRNIFTDVFLRDRETGELSILTIAADGSAANEDCDFPIISRDGRFVWFMSRAGNLLAAGAGPLQGPDQIFLHDRVLGTFERVSFDTTGGLINQAADIIAGTPDGRFTAYVTQADDIVPDDTGIPFGRDVFVYDRVTGETERVNVSTEGAEADTVTSWSWDRIDISLDGRYVAFASYASNLVPDDTNEVADLFLRDRELNTTTRISMAFDGSQANGGSHYPQFTADGDFIFFSSSASNLIENDTNGAVSDIYIYDMRSGDISITALTESGAQANGLSQWPDISADGRYVVFESLATNYDPEAAYDGSLEIFVHDRVTSTTVLASPRGSSFGWETANAPSVSDDGSFVAYRSTAANLLPNDFNQVTDVFGFVTSPASIVGDLDGDGDVDFSDLLTLLNGWGACAPDVDCPADLDGSGDVGFADLLTLLASWS